MVPALDFLDEVRFKKKNKKRSQQEDGSDYADPSEETDDAK